MKITIPNLEIIADPLSGAKTTIDLVINSKITINGDMVVDGNNQQQNRDIINSEIYHPEISAYIPLLILAHSFT